MKSLEKIVAITTMALGIGFGCYGAEIPTIQQFKQQNEETPIEYKLVVEQDGRKEIKTYLNKLGFGSEEYPLVYEPWNDPNHPPPLPGMYDLYGARIKIPQPDGTVIEHLFLPDIRVLDGKNNNLYLEFNSETEGEFCEPAINYNNSLSNPPPFPMYAIKHGVTKEQIRTWVGECLAKPRL